MKESELHQETIEHLNDRLHDLVEMYSARKSNGEDVSVDSFAAQYPEMAEDLRRYLPAVALLAELDVSGTETSPSLTDKNDFPKDRTLGDFRILQELGRGGMGVVYEAEQISIGRSVALKVLPFAAVLDNKQITRFKNEARAAGTLSHPNIVPVYAVGEERGVYYYAMELIDGQSLAELVFEMRANIKADDVDHSQAATSETKKIVKAAISTQRSSQSTDFFRTLASMGIEAAEALQFADDNGVLHRDIKPANLLLDTQGKLWITDFGLARMEVDAGMTMTGDMLGTLRYMSPEQALAKRAVLDHRTDIYSLGITLYELVALRPPFDATDRQELLKQIAFDEAVPLRKLYPDVPRELETIIHKAISKDPDERYQSAQEVADDLRRYLEHRPIFAKRTTIAKRIQKWSKRHSWGLTLSSLAFATLCVILSIANISIRNAEKNAVQEKLAAVADFSLATKTLGDFLSYLQNTNSDKSFDRGRSLLTSASTYYNTLLENHSNNDDVLYESARGFYQVGLIGAHCGSDAEAREAFSKSRELYLRLLEHNPGSEEYLIEGSQAIFRLAIQNGILFQPEASERYHRESVDLMKENISSKSGWEYRARYAKCLSWYTNYESDLDERCQLQIRNIKLVKNAPDSNIGRGVGLIQADLRREYAQTLKKLGKPREAEKELFHALRLYERATLADPPVSHSGHRVAVIHIELGTHFASVSELSLAQTHFESALDLITNQERKFGEGRMTLNHLVRLHSQMGELAERNDQHKIAESHFAKAWGYQVTRARTDPNNPRLAQQFAHDTIRRARAFASAARPEEALNIMRTGVDELERSVDLIRQCDAEQKPIADASNDLANRYTELAQMFDKAGDRTNTSRTLAKALAVREKLANEYQSNTKYSSELSKLNELIAKIQDTSN